MLNIFVALSYICVAHGNLSRYIADMIMKNPHMKNNAQMCKSKLLYQITLRYIRSGYNTRLFVKTSTYSLVFLMMKPCCSLKLKDKLNIRGETNLNVSHRQVRCVTKNKQTGEQYCNIAHLHEDLQMFPKHCRVLSICKMNDFRMCICNGQTKVCFTPIETGFCVTLHMRFMFMKYFFSLPGDNDVHGVMFPPGEFNMLIVILHFHFVFVLLSRGFVHVEFLQGNDSSHDRVVQWS